MESFGDDVNSVFHEDQNFFKSDTIFVTFEIFGKSSESVNFDLPILWKFSGPARTKAGQKKLA